MTRHKVKVRFISINGTKMVMGVYRSLLGTIYKALRDDNRVFDISIDSFAGVPMTYQDYVSEFGGLVVSPIPIDQQ